MNQRAKRSKDRKHQNLNQSVVHTGGFTAAHSRTEKPEVKAPQKTTGDVSADKMKGAAKASPYFSKVEEAVEPKNKEDEKKAIAKATEKESKNTKK